MANPNNDYLWNLLNGNTSKQAFNMFKTEYMSRQKNPIVPSLPTLPMKPIPVPERENPIPSTDNIIPNFPPPNTKKPGFDIGGTAAAVGSVGTMMANIGKPDVGLGTLSGVATGAGYGAMFGPLGAGIGAAIGGITGLISTGLNRSKYEDNKLSAEKGRIKAATVFGSDIGEFEGGGNVGGEDGGLTPIQTSVGETITLSDGHIYRSKSTKTHKQIPTGLITDILPPDAYVASASPAQKISKNIADKMVLGYDTIEYTEEGNSSLPNKNTLGDLFSKQKMTPAELMLIVKNKFPTNDLEMDAFARKANVANLKSRLPYINAIIAASK